MIEFRSNEAATIVALLAEGVDRNRFKPILYPPPLTSPSSRRAWIEIPRTGQQTSERPVALLAEGVDRNCTSCSALTGSCVALLAEGVDRNKMMQLVKEG